MVVMLMPAQNFALAQTTENQTQFVIESGPYHLLVHLDTSILKTSQDIPLSIELLDGNPVGTTTQNTQITVETDPSKSISANPLKVTVTAAPDGRSWQGKLNYPVSGQWLLRLDITGKAGKATADTGYYIVSAPPAIPGWLAWATGLMPGGLFLIFLVYRATQSYKSYRKETLQLA
jgi:hypothetical protein